MKATLRVKSHDLHMLLKTAAMFATTDKAIPAINVVRLVRKGDHLLALSTDRFRGAAVRIPLDESLTPHGQVDMSLRLDEVKAVLPMLKVAARDQHNVDVTLIDEDATRVTVGGMAEPVVRWVRSDGVAGELVNAEKLAGGFPKLWALFPDDEAGQHSIAQQEPMRSAVAVDPKHLADFTKAAWGARDQLVFEPTSSPNRPITVRVGRHFVGILMPVRSNGSEDTGDYVGHRAYWADLFEHWEDES